MCSLLVSWVFWVESWPNPTLHFKYGRYSEDPEEDQEKDEGDRQRQADKVHDAQDPHQQESNQEGIPQLRLGCDSDLIKTNSPVLAKQNTRRNKSNPRGVFIEAKSINQFGWFWIIRPSLVIIPEVDFSSSSYQTIQFRLNQERNKFSIQPKQLNLNSIEATHSITKQIKIQRHSVSDPEAPVQKLHYSTNLILSWRWGVVECRCPDVLSSASSVCLHPPGEGEARRTKTRDARGKIGHVGECRAENWPRQAALSTFCCHVKTGRIYRRKFSILQTKMAERGFQSRVPTEVLEDEDHCKKRMSNLPIKV